MVNKGFAVKLLKRLDGFELDTCWHVDMGFTVLFGYSGAGKSLTMAMIVGIMRPDEGWVRFGEDTLVDTDTDIFVQPQQRDFGYVSQNSELFPHLTVRRNVAFGLHKLPRSKREDRVEEMLDTFGIAALAEKRPHELSGGEKQRAALARALAPRPRALLLDEPLSALDLPVRGEIRNLLRNLQQQERIPILMITHDLYEATALADTLVVYSGTGVVQSGVPHELMIDPGTPEIRHLLHSATLSGSILN